MSKNTCCVVPLLWNFRESQNYRHGEQIRDCLGSVAGEGTDCEQAWGNGFMAITVFQKSVLWHGCTIVQTDWNSSNYTLNEQMLWYVKLHLNDNAKRKKASLRKYL